MEGYDRLSQRISRIAVYPILLLPNTDYTGKRDLFGITAIRGDSDDFEYVLAHNSMTFAENQDMQRFLFWARVIAENAVLRHIWAPLRRLAGISQSQVLRNLDGWIAEIDDPAAVPLREAVSGAIGGTAAFGAAIAYLYTEPDARRLLQRWWTESITPLCPAQTVPVLSEVFRYDLLTQPMYRPAGAAAELPVATIGGEHFHLMEHVELAYDIPHIVSALQRDEEPDLAASPCTVDLYFRVGSESAVTSTNHEIVMHFMGMTLDQVMTETADVDANDHPRVSGHGHRP
ncbi:hypothetical protein GCM10017581_054860 [Dactylosporangium matsuzakiense]|uniref:Uncharacterized protein n=1 Tax=Dactylosporangium matsuzakiense TaxID=53360 RepID=A0A9W6KP57_9ACTN|nr:hypothetical protein GCM10017581_054860 [Dactylosporangium matsuzakiense]